MNNKGIGAVFCLIAAILMSARYISAAVFMSNVNSWDSTLFQPGLRYIGPTLKITSIISLVAGVVFLGFGIYQDVKSQKEK